MSVEQVDAFEERLRLALQVSLPAAPRAVIDRLERGSMVQSRPRPRLGLVLVPAAVALLLVAVALNVGNGPMPNATAAPSGPAGLFERVSISAFEGAAIMRDVWVLGQGLVGVVWGERDGVERAELVRSENGRIWSAVPQPRDGFVIDTGTVVNGVLHVLGRTGTSENPVWWHDAIDEAGQWREIGQVTGLPGSSRIIELAYGSAGWLARLSVRDEATETPSSDSQINYSRDGLAWVLPPVQPPVQPHVPNIATPEAPTMYIGVGTNGSSLFVFRYLDSDAATTTEVVATDGETWTVHDVTSTLPGPRFMAFDGKRFVGIGSAYPGDSTAGSGTEPAAWTSIDGVTWQRSRFDNAPPATSGALTVVTTSDAGFVAVGYDDGDIWLSPDGATWRAFSALPAGATWMPYAVAALGTEIVIASIGPDFRPAVWVRGPVGEVLEQGGG